MDENTLNGWIEDYMCKYNCSWGCARDAIFDKNNMFRFKC